MPPTLVRGCWENYEYRGDFWKKKKKKRERNIFTPDAPFFFFSFFSFFEGIGSVYSNILTRTIFIIIIILINIYSIIRNRKQFLFSEIFYDIPILLELLELFIIIIIIYNNNNNNNKIVISYFIRIIIFYYYY